jgi:hypothetical protein
MSRHSNVEIYLILGDRVVKTAIAVRDPYGISLVTQLAQHSCFGLVSIQRLHVLLTYDVVTGSAVFGPLWTEDDDGRSEIPDPLLDFIRGLITREEMGIRFEEAGLAVERQLGNG